MDKAVEELQQELKLLKNEIKETLTDVREVLLNTVENPFPQDSGASPVMAAPVVAAPVVAPPPPPVDAAPQEQPPAQQPQQQQQQMPQAPNMPMPQGGGGGGGPIVLGNMGGGGGGPMMPMNMMGGMPQMAPDMGAGPGFPPASAPEYAGPDDFGAELATETKPAGGPGLPPAGGRSRSAPKTERPSAGPGLPPGGATKRGSRDSKKDEEEEDDRDQRGRKPEKGRGDRSDRRSSSRPEAKAPTRGRRGAASARDLDEDTYDDEYEDEYEYDDDDGYEEVERQPKGKVDLVVLASLSPWLTEGIRRMGRKRVKSLLEVYASMGGLSVGMKDVLMQIVDLDDTEGALEPVAVHDTMRFLIELDDLMWRGRQDWRRAALVTMLGAGLQPLGE
jgi:hypothetical protein